MRIEAKDPLGHYHRVIDLRTQEILAGVLWADDQRGEYEVALCVEDGVFARDERGNVRTEVFTGQNIRIEVVPGYEAHVAQVRQLQEGKVEP